METLAIRFHEEVGMIPPFDLLVFYAVNTKLKRMTQLDPVVQVSVMWFNE